MILSQGGFFSITLGRGITSSCIDKDVINTPFFCYVFLPNRLR